MSTWYRHTILSSSCTPRFRK